MRISDWSSDVCSSDLIAVEGLHDEIGRERIKAGIDARRKTHRGHQHAGNERADIGDEGEDRSDQPERSEEHTSELQSLMRISYAVFCLKKKQHITKTNQIYKD